MGNEKALSPVIGIVLAVAITVILAALIGAFVFGMSGNIQKINATPEQTPAPVPVTQQKHAEVVWDDGDLMKAHITEDKITCYILRDHMTDEGMNQFYTMSCIPDRDMNRGLNP